MGGGGWGEQAEDSTDGGQKMKTKSKKRVWREELERGGTDYLVDGLDEIKYLPREIII